MLGENNPEDDLPIEGRPHFQAAFHQTAAERAALRKDELRPLNLEIKSTVAIVLGAVPHLVKWRDAIRELPRCDARRIEQLPVLAEALFFANLEYLAAASTRDALAKLAVRAAALRDLLLSDARALAKHGLIDATPLKEIKRSNGYLAMATEMGILTRILRERWPELASRTAIRAEDLEIAEELCERITREYAARKQPSQEVTRAADERRRAFTLVVGAYEEARRAMSFLRWSEGDVETVVPSLWRGRGRRARAAVTGEEGGPPVAHVASGGVEGDVPASGTGSGPPPT